MSDRKRQPSEMADAATVDDAKSAGDRRTDAPTAPKVRIPPWQARMLRVAALTILGPLLAIAMALYLYLSGGRYVSTDNAYVKSDKVAA